jgi:uncharacterized protein YhfF
MWADVFAFRDSREMADRLAMLVGEGVKTATARRSGSYEEEQKSLPQRGDYSCRARWKLCFGSGYWNCRRLCRALR